MSLSALIAREAAVGAVINGVLSAGFAWAAFGGAASVPSGALVADAVPQSFAVAFMATLVPTLLIRARMRRGAAPAAGAPLPLRLPRHAAMRALIVAAAVALAAWGVHAMLFAVPSTFAAGTAIAAKTLYGALLGAAVTALAVRAALCEPAFR